MAVLSKAEDLIAQVRKVAIYYSQQLLSPFFLSRFIYEVLMKENTVTKLCTLLRVIAHFTHMYTIKCKKISNYEKSTLSNTTTHLE